MECITPPFKVSRLFIEIVFVTKTTKTLNLVCVVIVKCELKEASKNIKLVSFRNLARMYNPGPEAVLLQVLDAILTL